MSRSVVARGVAVALAVFFAAALAGGEAAPSAMQATEGEGEWSSGLANVQVSLEGGVATVTYDLDTSDGGTADVVLAFSKDGGAAYPFGAPSATGDVGSSIPNGPGKTIVWDMDADYPGECIPEARVRVGASDSVVTSLPVEMVYVPAGSFEMGDPWEEGLSDEHPVHTATLSPYEIGKYEVTNAQVAAVYNWAIAEGKIDTVTVDTVTHHGRELLDLGHVYCQISESGGTLAVESRDGYSMAEHPVVMITWYGAVAFCNWASEMEGRTPCYDLDTWERTNPAGGGYRLPTEAEWERAAAWDPAGDGVPDGPGRHYRHGNGSDSVSCATVNYQESDYCSPLGLSASPYTSPVGYYAGVTSPAGCFDMSGNVLEWCQDWYDPDFYGAGPEQDPCNCGLGSVRVLRGGSWNRDAYLDRSANRGRSHPESSYGNYGFRVARAIPGGEGEGEGEGEGGPGTTLPPEMAFVPAGSFEIGDPWKEGSGDELPGHTVTLSPYEIGKYEVTNAQVAAVYNWAIAEGKIDTVTAETVTHHGKELLDLGHVYCQISESGGTLVVESRDGYSMVGHPVVIISWYGAVAFCQWLSEMEGRTPCYDLDTWERTNPTGGGYRLPTESEWERAAAWDPAGDGDPPGPGRHFRYGTGSDSISCATVNYYEGGYCNPLGLSAWPYTSPVGYYAGVTSPAGCFDMCGNVGEWCQDWFNRGYFSWDWRQDPWDRYPTSCQSIRGGEWNSTESFCQSGPRGGICPAGATAATIGFRVARGIPVDYAAAPVYAFDHEPPVITVCASDPGPLPRGGNCEAVLPDLTAGVEATDNCGVVTVSQSPPAGTVISADTLVTLTATDGAGLVDTCAVTVTVEPCHEGFCPALLWVSGEGRALYVLHGWAWDGDDVDGNGIGEKKEWALVERVLCEPGPEQYAVWEAYEGHLALLQAEPYYATHLQAYEHFLAAILLTEPGSVAFWRDTLRGPGDAPLLTGAYTAFAREVEVYPFAGEGDYDEDGSVNRCENDYALERDELRAAYAEYATDPAQVRFSTPVIVGPSEVAAGHDAIFRVEVCGVAGTPWYQWTRDDELIYESAEPVCVLEAVSEENEGTYRAMAGDGTTVVQVSAPFYLTVLPPVPVGGVIAGVLVLGMVGVAVVRGARGKGSGK